MYSTRCKQRFRSTRDGHVPCTTIYFNTQKQYSAWWLSEQRGQFVWERYSITIFVLYEVRITMFSAVGCLEPQIKCIVNLMFVLDFNLILFVAISIWWLLNCKWLLLYCFHSSFCLKVFVEKLEKSCQEKHRSIMHTVHKSLIQTPWVGYMNIVLSFCLKSTKSCNSRHVMPFFSFLESFFFPFPGTCIWIWLPPFICTFSGDT